MHIQINMNRQVEEEGELYKHDIFLSIKYFQVNRSERYIHFTIVAQIYI